MSSENLFDGDVVLVTGGSKGIGRAAAHRFARQGARVVLTSRHLDEVSDVAEEIASATGQDTLPLEADIADPAAVEAAYDELISRFGRLDALFANAGVNGQWAPIEELSVEDWRKTIDINLTGTFLTLKHAVPHLKETEGAIVITSSINGTRDFSLSGATAYASSKAGQRTLAQMLALELAPDGVRVNVICPGTIDTEIEENTDCQNLEHVRYSAEYPEGKVPLTHGAPGDPDDVAEVVTFLASDRAGLITGSPVWIDGAQSLLVG
ncbi:MAG: 3-oxoacyl-[acyl-carrier-protein] reductase [Bacteroidetes bacterium QH_9_67_14]|nr:MAG: 3-oxoacyl-[acyl-carrier-protein] reductase [Bacteroidetes bacterium QH_9_67_14]